MAKHHRKKKRPSPPANFPIAKTSPATPPLSVPWKSLIIPTAIIVLATAWIYWPALHGGWLWDDDQLVTRNALIHDPNGFWKIWLEPNRLVDYFPLKVSVEWLEWQLWQDNSFGYHLLNVILHTISALLLWRLLSKFGLRLAWLGGLIFAVHPVMVESVAWIAELKNTLSLPFFLLAMCAFFDYEQEGKRRDYFLALGLFVLAMLCKTTPAMFPFVILLFAWWKRGRIGWSDLKASAPFFLISLVMGLITLAFLHSHIIGHEVIFTGGFLSRLTIVGLSLAFYFSKCLLPVGLMPIYPKWEVAPPSPIQFLPWLILGGVLFWLWTKRATWGRHALLGLGFFLINLVPFSGITAGSYMRFTWVMDHFLYIPSIGLIGLIVAAAGQIDAHFGDSARPLRIGIVAAAVLLLILESRSYAMLYVDQETLSTYTVEANPEAIPAHESLGDIALARGELEKAMTQYRQVLAINPNFADAHCNLGIVLYRLHRLPEAIDQYQETLRIHPDDPETHGNLGVALMQMGKLSEAIDHFQQALKIDPDLPGVRQQLDAALQQAGSR